MDHAAKVERDAQWAQALIDPALRAADELSKVFDQSLAPLRAIPGCQLVREIHRGSQGVVYEAIQLTTRRKVAVKILSDSICAHPRARARFRREVQILGQLRHPHIVSIHQSGTSDGLFYFVMDHISGRPLDAYMAGGDCSLEDAIRLFAKVCEAVNAAHLRGVIHRDLKPSNILIDTDDEPHVVDFGLAKLAVDELVEETHLQVVSKTGEFMGSVPWASPEQAEGNPSKIDLRTDVYSLGVIFYQMLTRHFPYAVAGNMRDVLDHILHADPVRPRAYRRDIDHEVETIILKALSKEPQRRYQTAGELARDLRSYLDGDPISAKRDSTLYIIGKKVRRHRGPVAVSFAFVAAAIAFVVTLSVMRQRGMAAERKAESIQLAFIERVLEAIEPGNPGIGRIKDLDVIGEQIESELAYQPHLQARLWEKMGNVFQRFDVFAEGEKHLMKSLETRRALFDPPNEDVASTLHSLSALYWKSGKFARGASYAREALELRTLILGEDHPDTAASMNHLATCLVSQGNYADGEALYRRALSIREQLLGPRHPEIAASKNNFATYLMERGHYEEAEVLLREAFDMVDVVRRSRGLGGGEQPQYPYRSLATLGACLVELGDFEEADWMLADALALKRLDLGDSHTSTASTLHWLGRLRYRQGQLAEAEEFTRQALEIRHGKFPNGNADTAYSQTLLGEILLQMGDPTQAELVLKDAYDLLKRDLPPGHWRTAYTGGILADCLMKKKEYERAEELLLGAVSAIEPIRGRDDPYTKEIVTRLVTLYDTMGRPELADPFRSRSN